MIMNSRLRIPYALGCALVLSVYSLTPGNTFAQEAMSAAAAPSTRTDAVTAAHAAHAVAPSEHAGESLARAGVVNINTATAAELERLPRVGPARAQAILALRAKITRFSKVEQLLRVKGIGRATFRKLRPMLALEGPTTLPEHKPK